MHLNDDTHTDVIRVAHLIADAARLETLRFFRTSALVSNDKSSPGHVFDPVTAADCAAENKMRCILENQRPDDGILGEEFGITSGTSGLTWVLDPIDGTRGFISGTPTWGVLIALADETGPIFGIIDQPYIGERFVGGLGLASFDGPHGQSSLQTRPSRALCDATILTTFPEVGTEAEMQAFRAVAAQARLTRYGMDCYGYALLAGGHVDLVIEAGLQPYDIQAPIAVVTAAGGIVTDWDGGPAHQGGRAIAAANSEIHAEALAILKVSLHD